MAEDGEDLRWKREDDRQEEKVLDNKGDAGGKAGRWIRTQNGQGLDEREELGETGAAFEENKRRQRRMQVERWTGMKL